MRQRSEEQKQEAERVIKGIRRATRKQYSTEEKIRIVLSGLRGEESIAELCRREGIAQGLYYSWSKEFLEAGKKRLAGDTARQSAGNARLSRFSCINRLAEGPLAPHVDAFKQYLTDRGYAANTFANCVGSIAHFAQWIHGRRLRVQRIDEGVVAAFLDEHLPRCHCIGAVQRDRRGLSAALTHLLVVLRAQGVIAPPAVSTIPVDDELRRYDEYMGHVRGLAPKTREIGLRIARRLLVAHFADGRIDIPAIKPEHVRRFFAQQAKLYSKPANAGTVVATLRGYFRYRASLGDAVHGLIGAMSYPANWQLSSLPKTLTAEEVEQLVGSLGKPGRSMMRADAIVRCALDLGLRSGEVARISLDDIDWRAGTITLRHRSLNTTLIYAKLDSRNLVEVALPWPGSAA